MSYFNSNGVNIYYESTGEGVPVVFVHEFAGDYRNWENQVRYLCRSYRCITFNARGYPPSDVPTVPTQYSQDQAVEDIANLMDHLRLMNAHIIGLSMGGYATLNFGIKYPKKSRSLVVAGAGHGSDPELRTQFLDASLQLAQRLERLGMKEGITHYANSDIRRRYKEKDPRGFEEFNKQFAEHSPIGSALTTRGCQIKRPTIYELEQKLVEMPMPVMIITGDDDEPCIQPSLFMKRKIPNARLWVMPRTTHPLNLEEPDDFNRAVYRFLTEIDLETSGK